MKLATMLLIISLTIFACDKDNYVTDLSIEIPEAPKFNLMAGTYNEDISITLSTEVEDAVIYYTLDGTEPTKNSLVYNYPIEIKNDGTSMYIKAILINNKDISSGITTSYYLIDNSYTPDSYNDLLTITDYQEQIIGKWIGKRTGPWTEDINVEITFNLDGTYNSKSLTPSHIAFYYGEDDEENTYYLYDIYADGSAIGYITRFNDSNRDYLKFIRISENLNILNFEYWNGEYGPLVYTLTRIE